MSIWLLSIMPAWSTDIADEFLRLAAANGERLNQLQLQDLVYIAHGWRLALSGEPLTGDRPEASETGPIYRRLANVFAGYGMDPLPSEIGAQSASLMNQIRFKLLPIWIDRKET